MCGKFTAMASWREVVAYSEAFTLKPKESDDIVTLRVMSNIPVIIWDRDQGKRRVVPMRWGFPHPKDYRRPQPIHARSETIDTTKAFAEAFRDSQRGILLAKTFNEAPESGEQHVITPGDQGGVGIAMIWRRFEIEGIPIPLLACCMVTVPANQLISALPTDRMPAILDAKDWGIWLGEEPADQERVKACLKTREEPTWTMKAEDRPRKKPTVSDPTGLI